MTAAARRHVAGPDIQTVPITNCAVTLPEADDLALDAFSKIRNRARGKTA